MNLNGYTTGLEAISFQKDKAFTNQLDKLHMALKRTCGKGTKIPKELSKLLSHRFGIPIQVVNVPDWGSFGALPIHPGKKSIMVSDEQSQMLLKIKPGHKQLTKTLFNEGIEIDLNKARVLNIGKTGDWTAGVFCDYQFGFGQLDFSARQTSAVVMHEVGHIFTFLEYLGRDARKNVILEDVLNYKNKHPKDTRTYRLMASKFINDKQLRKTYESSLKDSSIDVVWGLKLARYMVADLKLLSLAANRTHATSEISADIFSSRMGYGPELVSALNTTNMYGKSLPTSYTPVIRILFREVVILVALMELLGVASMLGGLLVIVLVWGIKGALYGYNRGESVKVHTYDDLMDRYRVIRNDYVEYVKRVPVDKAQLKVLVQEVSDMDALIVNAGKMKVDSKVKAVVDRVFTANSRELEGKQLERSIEDLVANDLFLRAAVLA